MENFDLDINNNGIRTEIGVPAKIIRMKINSNFEGEETISDTSDKSIEKEKVDKQPKEKAWYEKLSDVTKTFKGLTTYGANKQGYNITEKGVDPKGTRVKILGLDPFVFVAISLTLVIASGIAIVVISKKQAKL
jgi:hypothetical protein